MIKYIKQSFRVVFCLFFMFVQLQVQASMQRGALSIHVKNASFKEVVNEISRKTDMNFIYSDQDVLSVEKKDYNFENAPLSQVLNELSKHSNLSYTVEGKSIVFKVNKTQDENKFIRITGKITDVNKQPIPSVTVRIIGSSIGVVSDMNGVFSIEVPAQGTSLTFSFIGMKTKTIAVTPKTTNLIVVMEENAEEMDEVVVTGMFERSKEGFTGSQITVDGADLKKFSATSVIKALSAVDPSFRIQENISAGSDPNRLPDLRMRGQATLPTGASSSDELISLKGEYSTYPNQPLLMLDGFEIDLQTMVDLDPDRVASITLLKDAAATAIYGSKAANGVIVIETKVPAQGALLLTYGGNVRFEMPDLSAYNLMNAEEKLEAERLAGFYPLDGDISYVLAYNEYLREVRRGVNTYWLSQPLRTSVQQRHSLSVEGGDRAFRYKLYAGANFTPGVMKESSRRTISGSVDLSYRFKKLRLRNSITIDDALGKNSPYGSFSEYAQLNPYLRKRGENGEILKDLQRPISNVKSIVITNPMYNSTFNNKNQTNSFTVREQFKVEYDPIESVRTQLDFSLSKGTGETEVFKPAQHTDFIEVTDPTLRGSYSLTSSKTLTWNLGLQVSYNKTFLSTHFVTGNVRFTMQENQNSNYGATVTGFPNDKMDNILFGRKYNEKVRGGESTSRTLGVVGTFGYSYMYKYSVDFNIRVDGSSQFGSENRFAPFWSSGLRWNVKKESWIKDFNAISNLVLRTSYGVTGTQGFAPYQSQQMYSYSNLLKPYLASDGTGATLVGIGNDELKWQKTNQTNIGAEIGFFDNRLTARYEYYWKVTKNSLTDISLAPSIGFSSIPENLGTINNKGMEIMLSVIPYRNLEKNASLILNVNGSHNQDKIVKISEALRHMNEQNAAATKNAPLPRYEEGRSQTEIWVVKSLGIDPQTGDEVFVRRLSGETTGIWDSSDLSPMGNSEPKLYGNINTSFNYMGFGFNMSFNYQFGGQAYNSTLVDRVENANLRYNADKRVLYDRWKQPGDKAKFKRLTGSETGGTTNASSRFIADEKIFRFSSLSLSYRMDTSTSKWLQKVGASSMSADITMEDIFYSSSIKRERGLDYPFARQFALSLNVVF